MFVCMHVYIHMTVSRLGGSGTRKRPGADIYVFAYGLFTYTCFVYIYMYI